MGVRAKVYITRQIPQKGLDCLLEKCNVSYWDSPDPAPRTELLMNVRGVDVLLCMPSDCIDMVVLNSAGPNLKIVATMSDDTDHIDLESCKRRNIRVVKINKVPADYISDISLALLVSATVHWMDQSTGNLNKVLESKNIIKSIKQDEKYLLQLRNSTVGIIGMGAVGLSLGKKLKDLGVASMQYSEREEVAMAAEFNALHTSLNDLAKNCDIIFVSSDLHAEKPSSFVFNKDMFTKMKSSVVLIDATKRFDADYSDLYDALRNDEITAVGLDVREYCVIPNRHPLAVLNNCYFLPYRECYKWDMRRKLSADLAKEVLTNLGPQFQSIPIG